MLVASPLGFEPRTTPLKAWFKTFMPFAMLIFVIILAFIEIKYEQFKKFQIKSRIYPA